MWRFSRGLESGTGKNFHHPPNPNLEQEIVMIGKLVATVAFVGMAICAVPTSTQAAMDEVSAQGAGMSVPGTGTAQGPIVQTRRPHKRHVKRVRHKRHTAR